jgi:imidazolonepropionase-like amidohydrolase
VAAKAIGTEEYGTLAEGKRADILAVNGNALHDIGALRDIQFVMKSGEVVVDYR